jgi:hypothetical protein
VTDALLTRWGRALDADAVLPEYPRPQLVRDSYLNLNGRWDYAITPADAEEPEQYDGQIVVPFSPEAPLSGVGRQLRPDQLLWYRRTLTLPRGFRRDRVLLHFGAVDQTCTVWLNGVPVGEHTGGYLPFGCDLTDALRPGANTLVVRVRDLSNGHQHASGKQRLVRGGIWYTAQSGIWQTVWVESVPEQYVERLTLLPHLEDGAVELTVHASRDGVAHVEVRSGDHLVGTSALHTGRPGTITLSDVHPWTPDDPHLYDVEVTLGDDRVTSYVGLRSFGTGPDEHGVPRLLLNGRPYFHTGVLDQGYWPDGLYTAPADDAMVHDIATMKRLGFTMLRKHLKVEPLRWYYHCDRLGMLVWQDLVNGGGRYRTAAVKWPGVAPIRLDDRGGRAVLGRADPAGRAEFLDELRQTIEHLRNVTSLAVWVPFNEGWGQFDANDVAARIKALDATRSVDHASGWHDQGGGDLRSLHVYLRRFRVPRRRSGDQRVLVLSEYGGYSLRVDGHTFGDKEMGYRRCHTTDELAAAFTRLHREEIGPAVARGLSATVYTQLSDVEDELNGLLTYDREVLKLPEAVVSRVLPRE